MRSDKVNTDLCEVTLLFRCDCKQKCHVSSASARCFEIQSVTLLMRSTGLEARACECYGIVKREFDRMLPRVRQTEEVC
jgi:hypothetical protein